jgi:4-amino-4-deoxychorismate lyase
LDKWLINGSPGDSIGLSDRGLHYGDGLFETIAVRNGSCRFLDMHFQRLTQGCGRLKIPVPDERILQIELQQLSRSFEHAVAKIILTRGEGPRGYRLPDTCTPTRIVGIEQTKPQQYQEAGVAVRFCTTLISRNPQFAGLKTLNRLEQVMARAECNDAGIAEGLMFNDREEVICGTMTNVFLASKGILYTPSLKECGVNGIMRQQVIAVAANQGIDVQEASLTKDDLNSADEIFLTNALIGLWPVTTLAGQAIGQGKISGAIRTELANRGVLECET